MSPRHHTDINRLWLGPKSYRYTKDRNKTSIRLRIPGAQLNAESIDFIKTIAERFGGGTVSITSRQGLEVPGIPYDKLPELEEYLGAYNRRMNKAVEENPKLAGTYPVVGKMTIGSCVGSRVCPYANVDTTALSRDLDGIMFPSPYSLKTSVTGCPNDCLRTFMTDLGIMALTEPVYDEARCIGCEACVNKCRAKAAGVLTAERGIVKHDVSHCIGCGECVLACPTGAWQRSEGPLFRILIGGRSGKKNPRMSLPFLDRIDTASLYSVIRNIRKYLLSHMDKKDPKNLLSYVLDRTGYDVFRNEVIQGISFNPQARVAMHLPATGYKYAEDLRMCEVSDLEHLTR